MRREWIEIPLGVVEMIFCRRLPPCGGSGLKYTHPAVPSDTGESPSMRREWIEISTGQLKFGYIYKSPSMRREWIEIIPKLRAAATITQSPSMRREWIEMLKI